MKRSTPQGEPGSVISFSTYWATCPVRHVENAEKFVTRTRATKTDILLERCVKPEEKVGSME